MSLVLKPCHCGYDGGLAGMDNGGYLSLTCSRCNRSVEAFTMDGLVEAWNKPAETEQQQEG